MWKKNFYPSGIFIRSIPTIQIIGLICLFFIQTTAWGLQKKSSSPKAVENLKKEYNYTLLSLHQLRYMNYIQHFTEINKKPSLTHFNKNYFLSTRSYNPNSKDFARLLKKTPLNKVTEQIAHLEAELKITQKKINTRSKKEKMISSVIGPQYPL